MVQEQVNDKTVALVVKGSKLTGRLLAQAMQAFLRKMREPPKDKPGKQSIRKLTRDGASLSNVEITDPSARQFDRIARDFNVRYTPKLDKSTDPPRHIIFFKAKDNDALMSALEAYTKLILKQKEKPKKVSLLDKLAKFKELAKSIGAPVRNRNVGGHEL